MPLSKRASLQAQRMMREAFMELERIITVSDRSQLKNLSLKDVQQAALQIEKQLAASQSLRNMRRLVPLFTGLGHYSQAIEVLCNGTPYLPWLWAPIKLVLKISADYIEAFEQIIKVYSKLAEPLARFNLFDRAYSNNVEVQNTLAVYYSDILKFHGEAYKFVRRNAWQRLFATSWGRFQRRFDIIFDDLKAHEDLVDKTVNAANVSEAKDMREKLEDWRQQEMAKLKKEEEERTSTEFRAVLSVLKIDETHQIKVFDHLISEASQNPGSCRWILQQPKIRSWAKCERDTQFAVLHGFVGSGKSVLAAQIATFLRASESSLVAAHFCTYLYPESTDYNYIMRSLMIQMIRLDPELITLSYDWLVLKKKAPSNTVVEQLLRLLVEAMGALPEKQKTLHIIIDGLDECDDITIASVVKTLNKLVTSASSSTATLLKVLLCTQMKPEVAKFVKKKHQVSLSSEKDHLNKAIQDYTLQRINAIRPSLSQLHITDDDVTALASQIAQKADGMFLWAKLVMEYINKNLFYHRDEIMKAAISLPRELGEFYGRMLSQIMANFDERSAQRISAVLSWIAFAKRPLRLAELLSALTFDAKQEQVDELVPAYILDRCEPLIQKQADSSYSFVHVSVRDFLQSSDTALLVTESESQKRHGLATVRCLLSGQQIFAPLYPDSERTLRVLRGLHGFHMYATEFWADYLLSSLKFDQAQFFDSEFFTLSCRLAESFIAAETNCEDADGSPSDPRLTLIRQKDYRLYKMVKVVLLEQNKEAIEVVSLHDDTTCIQHDNISRDVITLKKKYQTLIQKLLNYSNYPGISFQQLEQFKQNFRTSAFTCRVWSCPYATLGFNNMDSLTHHEEAEHSKHICRVQGCQYPVFTSARLLKNHVTEHHTSRDQRLERKSIRKRPAPMGLSGPDYATSHVADQIEAPEEEPRGDIIKINCICGFSENNHLYGNIISCDICGTWQHIECCYPGSWRKFQEGFSHRCADCCEPGPLNRAMAIERILLLRNSAPEPKSTAEKSKRPSRETASLPPPAANISRQTTPRVGPASLLPSGMMHQDSQMIPQLTRNDLITKYQNLQDDQIELMLQEMRQLERERKQELLQQRPATPQKSMQDEDMRRPLNNNNQPAGEQDSSFGLTHYSNKIVPKLDRTTTDVYGDGLLNDVKFGRTNDNGGFDGDFKLFNNDKLDNENEFLGWHQDIDWSWKNLSLTPNSSSQPSLAPAVPSDVFNQRISSANSQHLNTILNSRSSSTSRDASPLRQSSSLAPLPPHDSAPQPRTSCQEPYHFRDQRDLEDYNLRDPRNHEDYYFYTDTRGTTSQTQQHKIIHALSLPAMLGLSTTQDNSLPLPIPPRLKVGGPRPPTPPPPPAPPLKATDLQSTLADYTSANKTLHSNSQAPYIRSSATELPYGPAQASSSLLTLPLVWQKRAILRICNNNHPCPTCVSSNRSFCSGIYHEELSDERCVDI
ncbi:hypothetical protein H0G86_001857 [Trichoderma simmonsii]|uniref:C2H2-type domain-containing protein n=1 Tax=Trichoderma simmonsii TaxID=1491479 RepID=A0A8G0L4M8_9HYPO|nr:hypothetical protein H0G86_001857 [Trichoderma simmonsii]